MKLFIWKLWFTPLWWIAKAVNGASTAINYLLVLAVSKRPEQ
jgi:hypothetical protein